MNEKNKTSYTAANSIPFKMFRDPELLETIVNDNKILPRHVQICPTNKCNLNCPFCSCDEVDKKQQWTESQCYNVLDEIKENQCKAVTVTGGGEPTLFPHINELLYQLSDYSIDAGLVSNGIELKKLDRDACDTLTWARISFSDFRSWDKKFESAMDYLRESENVDLAFSYVVTDKLNSKNIKELQKYANANHFTHVRYVDDIFNPDPARMDKIKHMFDKVGINDDSAIYQTRNEYTKGDPSCLISLLKPLIAPDGFVYPCCGVQYALPDNQKTFPKEMRMGHFTELGDIIDNAKNFNGSKCTKCYYQNYNTFLNGIKKSYDHEVFV